MQVRALPAEQLVAGAPTAGALSSQLEAALARAALPQQQTVLHAHAFRALVLRMTDGIDGAAAAARRAAEQAQQDRLAAAGSSAAAELAATVAPKGTAKGGKGVEFVECGQLSSNVAAAIPCCVSACLELLLRFCHKFMRR